MSGQKKRRLVPSAGRGSVLVIAMLLLSSASLRIVTGAGTAFAEGSQLPNTLMPAPSTSEHNAPPGAETEPGSNDNRSGSDAKKSTFENIDRSEMSNLISALSKREIQVAEREKQLEMRMRALSVADAEIEKRMLLLTDTENSLRATLALADEASEKDIVRLVSVYESMKPKGAAALFEEMEPGFAAGFLGRMRPDSAAEILTGMSPQAAYSISVILAGRNANVPKT